MIPDLKGLKGVVSVSQWALVSEYDIRMGGEVSWYCIRSQRVLRVVLGYQGIWV